MSVTWELLPDAVSQLVYQQAVQTIQERSRARASEGKHVLPLPAAPARRLSDQVLEERNLQAQRRLLTGTCMGLSVSVTLDSLGLLGPGDPFAASAVPRILDQLLNREVA